MQQLVLFFHEWIISYFHRSFVFGAGKCTLRRINPELDAFQRLPRFGSVEAIGPHIPHTVLAWHRIHSHGPTALPDHHMRPALLPHEVAPEQGGAKVVRLEVQDVGLRVGKELDAEVVILRRAFHRDGPAHIVGDRHIFVECDRCRHDARHRR